MKKYFFATITIIIALVLTSCGGGGGGGSPITGLPPTAAVLISPLNVEGNLFPNLRWSISPLASTYDVQLWKSTDSAEYLVQNLTNPNYTVQTALDPSTLYYWKVISKNDYGLAESSMGAFSTSPTRTGNYIEIRDIQANTNGTFTIVLAGTITGARAMRIMLNFDSVGLDMAPDGNADIQLSNLQTPQFILIREGSKLDISIATPNDFNLTNQDFLSITCDAKTLQGVFQVTMYPSSEVLDGSFNQIGVDISDTGYVFIN